MLLANMLKLFLIHVALDRSVWNKNNKMLEKGKDRRSMYTSDSILIKSWAVYVFRLNATNASMSISTGSNNLITMYSIVMDAN